jgi:hypothetical protein
MREVFTGGRGGSAGIPVPGRKVLKSMSRDPLTPNATGE